MSGIANIILSSIERRYNLPSSTVALIPASYAVSSAIMCFPVGYFAIHGHKPRILTIAPLFLSVGCFLLILPHWIGGNYLLGSSVCVFQEVTTTTTDDDNTTTTTTNNNNNNNNNIDTTTTTITTTYDNNNNDDDDDDDDDDVNDNNNK